MAAKFLYALMTVLVIGWAQGFTHPKPSHFGGIASPTKPRTIRPVTILSMAEESEESKARRKTQQVGAAAVLFVGIVYDFFVTHHGVGFWDPNYIP